MDYLDKLEKQANKMFARVEGWEINALKRVGRRVKDIRHLSYADLQAINNAAISNQDVNAVLEELAEITGQNVRDVKAAYDEMIAEQHEINRHLYDYRGKKFVPFKENKTLQAITRAFARTTAESFVNLSMTSAKRIGFVDAIGTFKPIDVAFTEVIDKAVMSVTTGTGDFNSEMLDVLRQLGGSGVRVDYGHGITRHLDSMVRQNMLWGAKQAYREYDRVIGEELGCDGVEIDWHSYPRPTHVFMQGKQYCLGKTRVINGTKFIGFEEKDPSSDEGKSASAALDDWGCLHFETSIICGVSEPAYTPEELKALNEKNNRPIEIDGVTKTGYEWKQSMRRLERGGKQAKMQRELFKADGNLPEARKWDERLKMIEDKYQLVADRTGMKAQYEKMAVIKAKALDKTSGSDIIELNTAPGRSKIRVKNAEDIINKAINLERPIFADDTFGDYVANVKKKDDFYDIAAHGTSATVKFFGEEIDDELLSRIIRQRKDYRGESIRLLSCNVGSEKDGELCFAQRLANRMGVPVEAPTHTIWVTEQGDFTVGKKAYSREGTMKLFYPSK